MHRHRTLRSLLLVVGGATALVSLTVAPAPAADDGNTSFAPAVNSAADPHPFVELDVRPGGRVEERVVLENRTKQRQTYDLYTADATSVDGAFVLSGADAKPTDLGAWLRLPRRKVVLGPSESRTIAIAIAVPANARPGDHAGGVVALPRATQAADSSSNVRLRARYGVGVRVYTTVKGPLDPELTASELTLDLSGGLGAAFLGAASATVSYQVTNSGNVTLAPTSTGEVTTRASTIDVAEHSFGEMLPASTSVVTEQVDGLRWGSLIGRVHVEVTVTADRAEPVTLEASAWRVPWLTLLGLGLLVALLTVIWVIRRRRRIEDEPTNEVPASEEPASGEPDPVSS